MKESIVVKLSELNQDQMKLLRQLCGTIVTQLDGFGLAELEEPMRGMFVRLKDEYNSILSKLPMTDGVTAALDAHWNLNSFLSCLTSTQAMLSYMTTRLSEMKPKTAMNADELSAKIREALDAMVAAGEFVSKDTVTSLCAAAKDAGATQARDEATRQADADKAKEKLISDRKAILATNSLPVPESFEALLGTEEEFNAHQERVRKQVKVLSGFGIALNSKAIGSAWASEAEFAKFTEFLTAAVKKPGGAGAGAGGDEAFAGGTETPPAKKGRLIV